MMMITLNSYKSKTRRNQEEASKVKSRCKEQSDPVVEEGSNKQDQEAGDCSLDLGTLYMLFAAMFLLMCVLLIEPSSC